MRAWFNMPTHEFVGQLRDIAIKAGARPAVIDCIDELAENDPKEVDSKIEQAYLNGEMDKWDDCFEALKDGLESVEIGLTETQIEQILDIMRMEKP